MMHGKILTLFICLHGATSYSIYNPYFQSYNPLTYSRFPGRTFPVNLQPPGAMLPFPRSGTAYPEGQDQKAVVVGPPVPVRVQQMTEDVNDQGDDDAAVVPDETEIISLDGCNKIIIATEDNPGVQGLFTPAILSGNTLYISGQLGFEPDTVRLADGIETQTRMALQSIENLLTAAAASVDDLVKVTVLLSDIDNYSAMNDVYKEFLADSAAPARAAYQVGALPFNALVEIEAVATLRPDQTRAAARIGTCADARTQTK